MINFKNPKILLFLIISVFTLLFFTFSFCRAATLYLLPQSQTIYQDDTFIVEVRLDTEGKEINAVEADLKFPSDLIEIIDFSKGGSILTLWVKEPSIKQAKQEEISFIGGIPQGFNGKGLISKITFFGKRIGGAEVSFKIDSKVLLNDGKGTRAELSFLEGNYEVIEKPENLPIISSSSHPDQNKWFKSNTFHVHWDLIEGAEYSYLLSKDPLAEPDNVPDRPEGELIWIGDMEYPNLEDGIYYFSLKQKLPEEVWLESGSYRVMIDATRPEKFKPEIGKDPSIFEGKYFLSFSTTDKMSGIEYFEVKEGKKDFKITKSPYLLGDQNLRSKILVKAVDKAGNEKVAEIIPPHKVTWKEILSWIVALLVISLVVWQIVRRILMNRRK